MANVPYPIGQKAVTDGDVDFLVDTISMQMYSGAAVFNAAHDFLSDVAGSKAGAAVNLTVTSTAGGAVIATVPAFSPPAVTVIAIVLYRNTGADGTSQLLGWIDQKGDGTPVSIDGDGSAINLNWTGPIYSIAGA